MKKHVRYFAKIAASMTNLLKYKFGRINWTSDCYASFEAMKKILTETCFEDNGFLERQVDLVHIFQ